MGACRSESPSERTPQHQPTAAGGAVPAPRCAPAVLSGAGVGALRVGAPIDSVRARCAVVRDTVELRAEGQPARVLAVVVGSDTVVAEVDSGRVWRIEVTRPSPRTADSLGVGTPLARLLALPGAHGLSGEGAVFVVSPARCGLSFQLSEARLGDAPPDTWDRAALRRLPSSTVVTRVLIVGCQAAA